MKNSYITGETEVSGIKIPNISPELKFSDYLGAVMVRWGFSRDNYRVDPGLYAIGNPSKDSDVFVTCNYKLTFDNLRKSLKGINGWILVLDTKGVNVWCAAGKGTFSTKELVNRIRLHSLEKVVSHRRLILPQLGATGVAAHKVRDETDFNVHYGPVRAEDINAFITAGYRADRDMRRVRFGFWDRIKLIPNDFMYGKYYLLSAIAIMLLLSSISSTGLSFRNFADKGGIAAITVFFAYFAGIVLTPLFLPYLPGRHFSLKGFVSGMIVFAVFILLKSAPTSYIEIISWFFVIGAISSFTAMNFTGSSTYTSLSGVKKEMKLFVPLQIGFAISGIALQIIGKLI